MPWECEIVSDVSLDSSFTKLLELVIVQASRDEPLTPSGDWSLTLRLTTDEGIASVHEAFFGDASPTDVVSFPSGDDLHSNQGYLGDIMISVETAAENAAIHAQSTQREVAFLALHGLLHLCGYTDTTDADRRRMLERQDELLTAFESKAGVRL